MQASFKYTLAASVIALLAACGGGESGPCGQPNQIFSISFPNSDYFGSVGSPLTVRPTINPASCISNMSLQISGGRLPPGMSISNGTVTGTPSTAGNYQFSIGIAGVTGYDIGSRFASSNTVTIFVSR